MRCWFYSPKSIADVENKKITRDRPFKKRHKDKAITKICGNYRRLADLSSPVALVVTFSKKKLFLDKVYDVNACTTFQVSIVFELVRLDTSAHRYRSKYKKQCNGCTPHVDLINNLHVLPLYL